MKTKRVATSGVQIAVAAGVLLASCGPLFAKEKMEGTAAERAACTPEVFRLCAEFIPNHEMIANCLRHNVYRLNKQCRKVFQ